MGVSAKSQVENSMRCSNQIDLELDKNLNGAGKLATLRKN